MAIANSRASLIDYCKRQLGYPVVEVNLDDLQVEDAIDDAIEYFRQYHFDGIEKIYLKHEVTADDMTNQYIPIPDMVYGVQSVFPVATGTSTSKSIFDLQYQLRLNDLYDLTSTSIIYYKQVMNHLSLLSYELNGMPMSRFNRMTGKLYLDQIWGQDIVEGAFILVEAYRALDPADAPRLYNDIWLKAYATALMKRQWGTNMKKFQGIQLPGGVTLDGQTIYSEALEEIRNLQEEMLNKSAPLEFLMG